DVSRNASRRDSRHLENAQITVAEHRVERMTHADAVHLGARLDEERFSRTELVPAEQPAHAPERREGRIDAGSDNPVRSGQRPPVEGRVPGGPEGVPPAVAAERGRLIHPLMVRLVY